ncbi:MAG: HypC/HybG/HupF family hydrogenase formation chaperone [Propionibacteriaceae bacterium]|nr:HypC/HybG/HupF family hydrogenase formation chaperone [Propionibacteriaceae bacterium]
MTPAVLDNDLIVLSDDDGCVSPKTPTEIHSPASQSVPSATGGMTAQTPVHVPAGLDSDESDEAGVVVAVPDGSFEPVKVRTAHGTVEEIDATLIEPVNPGDHLLIHDGTAIARI